MHLNAKRNEYAAAIARIIDDIPKAVLAAIAVSALTSGGDRLNEAMESVSHEWLVLWSNGIVPQKPPAHIRELAIRSDIAKHTFGDEPTP